MTAAQHLLDRIQTLPQLTAFEADPASYAAALDGEIEDSATAPALAARDARLGGALGELDAMIERAARIRLEHALAAESAIAAPTRKVFATTITGYAGRLDLLEARARDTAARGGARDPARVAAVVVEAARAVLALRDAARAAVLAVIQRHAHAGVATADGHARDRRLDPMSRTMWSAMRRELAAIANDPERVAVAPLAVRLAGWPEQLDEPEPEPERTFADMIELD